MIQYDSEPFRSGFQVPRLEIYATGNFFADSKKIYQARYVSKYFLNCEFVSVRINEEGLECYLKIDFVDEASLDAVSDHPTLKIQETISKSYNPCTSKASTERIAIPIMFFEIPDVWWVYPTKLDEHKFTITVRGTTAALRQGS